MRGGGRIQPGPAGPDEQIKVGALRPDSEAPGQPIAPEDRLHASSIASIGAVAGIAPVADRAPPVAELQRTGVRESGSLQPEPDLLVLEHPERQGAQGGWPIVMAAVGNAGM